jgi:serine/threonine-protein kinase
MLDSLQASLAGRYDVKAALGEGGTALVYHALDVRHDRAVALKVLRPELSAVIGAERFLNEIRVTANLQHPHILPLYDSGALEGLLYYVMPYVGGESLRARLSKEGQLPIREAVRITVQVAGALEYAHRQGVVHRDIKPENILLHEGQALVADFGIALALGRAGGTRLTNTGLAVGTPQYMSPEQASGDRQLDPRTDVYSLGAVLYEMLAGQPPFTGPSVQAVLTRLVTEQPRPVREHRDTVSPALDGVLLQALARLPADRFAGAGEFAAALAQVQLTITPSDQVATQAVSPRRWSPATWRMGLVGGLVVLAAATGWLAGRSRGGSATRPARLTVATESRQVDPTYGWFPTLAISPDGRALILQQGGQLVLRPLDSFTAAPLTGTEGASMPGFSPDGRSVVFHQEGRLRKLALAGGSAVEIAQASLGPGIAWGEDDRIYFSSLGGLGGIWRVPAAGGTPEPITQVADSAAEHVHAWPQLLPGGLELLFTVLGPSGGALDSRIVTEIIGTGQRTTLVHQGTFGRLLPNGQLLYVSNEGTVFAARYDRRRRTLVGSAQPVLTDVHVPSWGGSGLIAISDQGTAAFVPGAELSPQIVRTVDRTGKQLGLMVPAGHIDWIRLSPDGRRIAANVRSPSKNDIWLFGPEGEPERVTFDEAEDEYPVWSPRGTEIAYTSSLASEARRIMMKSVEGGTRPRRVLTWPRHIHLQSWSPNGQWLLGDDVSPTKGHDVWAIAADGLDSIPVAAGPASESNPDFSPDGKWVAYQSDESGRSEIFVTSFPDPTVKRQISTDGGRTPRWDPSGGTLYYFQGETLMAVRVSPTSGLRLGPGQALLQTPARVYDVDRSGSRIVLVLPNPDHPIPDIHVVVDWLQELERKTARR